MWAQRRDTRLRSALCGVRDGRILRVTAPDRHRLHHLAMRTLTMSLLLAVVSSALSAQTRVSLLDYATTIPATWTETKSTSSMRLAQFTLPTAAGTSAEVIVYYFGPGQGGSVDANVARWRGQFSPSNGKPVYERVAPESGGRFPITVAEFRGTYARGMGTGNASAAKADQTLIALIAETPSGPLFFQLIGDVAAATPHRAALLAAVRALK
jgi:hypothetical protein